MDTAILVLAIMAGIVVALIFRIDSSIKNEEERTRSIRGDKQNEGM